MSIEPVSESARVDALETRLLQIQIDVLKQESADHEKRLRNLEEVAVEYRLIKYLTAGGGIIGVLNLISIVFLLMGYGGK